LEQWPHSVVLLLSLSAAASFVIGIGSVLRSVLIVTARVAYRTPQNMKMEREVLAVSKRVLGAEHPHTLNTANNLAASLKRQGKYDEPEKMQREVLTVRKGVLGADHPDTLTTADNLADSLSGQGK
jgi:type II secretory pathway component PulJ